MDDHIQRVMNMVAILAQKLGGEVVITQQELMNPPEATVTVNPDQTLSVRVGK